MANEVYGALGYGGSRIESSSQRDLRAGRKETTNFEDLLSNGKFEHKKSSELDSSDALSGGAEVPNHCVSDAGSPESTERISPLQNPLVHRYTDSDSLQNGGLIVDEFWPELKSYATGIDGTSIIYGDSDALGILIIDMTRPIADGYMEKLRSKANEFVLHISGLEGRGLESSTAQANITVARKLTEISVSSYQGASRTHAPVTQSELPARSIIYLIKKASADDDQACSIYVRNYGADLEGSEWLFDLIPDNFLNQATLYFNGKVISYGC